MSMHTAYVFCITQTGGKAGITYSDGIAAVVQQLGVAHGFGFQWLLLPLCNAPNAQCWVVPCWYVIPYDHVKDYMISSVRHQIELQGLTSPTSRSVHIEQGRAVAAGSLHWVYAAPVVKEACRMLGAGDRRLRQCYTAEQSGGLLCADAPGNACWMHADWLAGRQQHEAAVRVAETNSPSLVPQLDSACHSYLVGTY